MTEAISTKRKLQVSNGYLMELDQLARVLAFLADQKSAEKVSRTELIENTGLLNRQIESLECATIIEEIDI